MVRLLKPCARSRTRFRVIQIPLQHKLETWAEEPVLGPLIEQNQTTAPYEANIGFSLGKFGLTIE